VEGTTKDIVNPKQITSYLLNLAKVTGMEILSGPLVYSAHEMGFGGWIHWKTSGAAFYSYPTRPPLFTVDCYTCKPFSVKAMVKFTRDYFEPIELVWKEVEA